MRDLLSCPLESVLLADESAKADRVELVQRRKHGELDYAWQASNLDRAGNRAAVAHLGLRHAQHAARAGDSVVSRFVERRPAADELDGRHLAPQGDVVALRESLARLQLLLGVGPRDGWQVFRHW